MEQIEGGGKSAVRRFKVDDFDQKAIFLCQFCGGEECDHENYLKNKRQPNAIEGLNSNWITDNILAMQRPSQRLIKKFNIYEKFKEKKIITVLNLQEPGQHPYCGDGIIPDVGFSYIPENFYKHGIHCFNESWEDMTSTTFEHMMRIMNIFDMSVREGGRISVHCHAGRGRTLLVICSWLIYYDRMTVDDVIKLAQEKRQGVLASGNQRQFLRFYEKQLHKRWVSYGSTEIHEGFCEFVQWQSLALLNREKKRLNSTAVAHYRLVRELRRIVKEDPMAVLQAFISPRSIHFKKKWDSQCETKLDVLKGEMNGIHFKSLKDIKDPRFLTQLLFDFYDGFTSTLLTSISIDELKDVINLDNEVSKIKVLLNPSVVHNVGVETIATILDFVELLNQILRGVSEAEQSSTRMEQCEATQRLNSKIDSNLKEALFMRLAMILLCKRKYYPQIFAGTHHRECKIYRYIEKIHKTIGAQVCYMTEFLLQLSKEMPSEVGELDRIIFKLKKVDSNLFYLLKEGKHGKTLSGETKSKYYQEASVKH